MPRSKRRIEADNRAIKRGRDLLQVALKGFGGKPQATAITQLVQGNSVWAAKVEADRPLLRYLWGEGFKILVRDALAEWGLLTPPGERTPQLELFPEDERDLVRQIGMARIWMPSRIAHVQYHDLGADELEEASAFYDALGQGNLRTAQLLRQLAALRKRRPPAKRAA